MARLDYTELNSMIRYTMWSVFRSEPGRLGDDRASVAAQLSEYLDALADKGVVVRGVYDLTGEHAGVEPGGAARSRGVQQEPRARVRRGGGAAGLPVRLPVRPVAGLVPAA